MGERYALALFDLANEQGAVAAVEADLKSLKTALADSRDLRTLVSSPAFSAENKGKGLAAVPSLYDAARIIGETVRRVWSSRRPLRRLMIQNPPSFIHGKGFEPQPMATAR